MADVFISYKREDRAIAEQTAQLLREGGYTAWFDVSLVAGEAFAESIRNEYASAGAVLTIWSQASWRSKWVQAESLAGFNAEKQIGLAIDGVEIGIPFNASHNIVCPTPGVIDIKTQQAILEACAKKVGTRRNAVSAHEIFFDSLIQKSREAPTYSVMGIKHDPAPYLLLAAKELATPDFSRVRILTLLAALIEKSLLDDAADLVARLTRNASHLGSDVSGVGAIIAKIGYDAGAWSTAVRRYYPGVEAGLRLRVADILFESGAILDAIRLAERVAYGPTEEGMMREWALDRIDKFRQQA